MLPVQNAKRRVIVAIKTTGEKPENGDRITEIACVEMMDLDRTGNNFQTFLFPGNRLMDKCANDYMTAPSIADHTRAAEFTTYAMKRAPGFSDADARAMERDGVPEFMMDALNNAPEFYEIEDAFMRYLRMTPDTVIIAHDTGRLKRFLRHEMTDKNWNEFEARFHDPKHGMMQKVHKFRPAGLFPESTGAWSKGLSFNAICTHFDVPVEGRTGYSAMQDALMLAAVVRNRKFVKENNIEMFPDSKSYPMLMDTDSDTDDDTRSLSFSM